MLARSRSLLSPRLLTSAPITPQYALRPLHSTLRTQDGLTNLFESDDQPALSITKLNEKGFVLTDNLVIPGGMIFLDNRPILWDVNPPRMDGVKGVEEAWKGFGKEAFGVLELVVPRPEILLLGTGSRVMPVPKAIREYVSGLGIQLDIMDTRNACQTFNLLQEEGRKVAAALCPLTPIDPRTGRSR